MVSLCQVFDFSSQWSRLLQRHRKDNIPGGFYHDSAGIPISSRTCNAICDSGRLKSNKERRLGR